MEGRWREDGGKMEGRWREDGGKMEGRWRGDGGIGSLSGLFLKQFMYARMNAIFLGQSQVIWAFAWADSCNCGWTSNPRRDKSK
jgi:hypothetical protein